MATEKQLIDEVNDYWIGWDGRGNNPVEYDLEDGPMREKMRLFLERNETTKKRVSEFELARNKYKRREK